MSIRCGNCKDRHPSVADIRACYDAEADRLIEWQEEHRADTMALAYAENAPMRDDWDYLAQW